MVIKLISPLVSLAFLLHPYTLSVSVYILLFSPSDKNWICIVTILAWYQGSHNIRVSTVYKSKSKFQNIVTAQRV